MTLVVCVIGMMAFTCLIVFLRVMQPNTFKIVDDIVLPPGCTLLMREIDAENDSMIHVRYRDEKYNLHVETYVKTLFGYKRIVERIMHNRNDFSAKK